LCSVLTLKRLVNNADSVVVLDNAALQRLSSEGGALSSGQSFDQTNQLVRLEQTTPKAPYSKAVIGCDCDLR
jgi:tubulin gamma